MDFAKKILGKYGWKEGDGLGKNNTGIAAPLKACLKFDNAGLGVDRATEFNDHWWERCFNEAASNVTVQVEKNGEVSTARKSGEDAVEISTKGYSARKLKKAKDQQRDAEGGAVYEHFLKSALLTQSGGEVADTERIKPEDIAVSKVHVMTDEELFKACGGRTAHKGARHGLKLSGKLARLEQQEREMLAKLQAKQNEADDIEQPTKSKKKKHKKDRKEEEHEEVSEPVADESEFTTPEEAEQQPTKSKKKKHKKDRKEEEQEEVSKPVADESDFSTPEEDEQQPTKSKKKKHKKDRKEEQQDEVSEPVADESESKMPAEPKKRKKEGAVEDETTLTVKSKKKKKKHKEME